MEPTYLTQKNISNNQAPFDRLAYRTISNINKKQTYKISSMVQIYAYLNQHSLET